MLARVSFAGTALLAPMIFTAIFFKKKPGIIIPVMTFACLIIFILSLLGWIPVELFHIRMDLLLLVFLGVFTLTVNLVTTDGEKSDPAGGFEFVDQAANQPVNQGRDPDGGLYPWNLENAPVALRTRGKILPDWKPYRHMAGPLPHSLPLKHLEDEQADEITLIPYGF